MSSEKMTARTIGTVKNVRSSRFSRVAPLASFLIIAISPCVKPNRARKLVPRAYSELVIFTAVGDRGPVVRADIYGSPDERPRECKRKGAEAEHGEKLSPNYTLDREGSPEERYGGVIDPSVARSGTRSTRRLGLNNR